MPMPELSASQDQTKDTAFPPTPFKKKQDVGSKV